MLNLSDAGWQKHGIDTAIDRFFVALWDEAVDSGVDYSFRPRSCNLPTLLDEIVRLWEVVQEFEPAKHHLPYLIDECIETAKADPIVQRMFPWAWQSTCELAGQKDRLDEASKRARVIIGHLHGYPALLRKELQRLLAGNDARAKENIEKVTHAWITTLMTCGYSLRFLREMKKYLVNEDAGGFQRRLAQFFEVLDGRPRSFKCYIRSRSLERRRFVDAFGNFSCMRIPAKDVERRILAAFGDPVLHGQDLLFLVEGKALDPFSLTEEILREFATAIQLVQMQSGPKIERTRSSVVAVHDEIGVFAPSSEDFHAPDAVPLIRPQHLRSKRASRAIQHLSKQDRERLLSAIQFLQISNGHATDETKLVTAWMGLETLVRGGGGNAIDQLTKFVPPCASTDLIWRLVENLRQRINVFLNESMLNESALPAPAQEHAVPLDAKEFMGMLLDREDDGPIKELFARICDQPILVYRLHCLRDHKLKCNKEIRSILLAHKRHVDWQIRRLARLRNDLVHRGKWDSRYRSIINHLQTYLHIVVVSVLEDCREYREWGLADALFHRAMLLERLLSTLANERPACDLASIFLNPNCLVRCSGDEEPGVVGETD